MKKIYWFIIDITTRSNGTQKVTFLYSMGWAKDKDGKIIEGYGSRYVYNFDTFRHLAEKQRKPIAFPSKKQALEELANIEIEGYLALVPSTKKTCFDSFYYR